MDHFVHVVDDEQAARWSASFLLSTLGMRCFEYQSGRHFLDQVANAPPGCVLLDVMMPGLSGLDVQAALIARSIRWPIIFVSGQEAARHVVTAVRRGAIDYLPKPYSEEQLLAALHLAFVRLRALLPVEEQQELRFAAE
jgi:FixJ family two-component response regulator